MWNLEAGYHFENVNRNILLESCVYQKIPLTTRTSISLEQILVKSFYLVLVLRSLFYSYISFVCIVSREDRQPVFLPEKAVHKI